MTRTVLTALTALLILAGTPSLALAKGPSEATIDGPGLAEAVSIPFDSQASAAFWRIVEDTGFFPAVFGQTPDPMLAKRPRGSLGPRYVMTYTLPGLNGVGTVLHQDVYPYARPRPVTYTRPGQRFFVDQETAGGWFVAEPSLKRSLVTAGLPETPPASEDDASFPWPVAALIAALGALVVAALGVRVRRRSQAAPAS